MNQERIFQDHNQNGIVIGVAAFITIAGLVHLMIAPQHWAHAPAHGLLFAIAGVAEMLWGIAFWRRPSATLYRVGMVMSGGLITLWAITRLLPAPFGHGPEPVEIFGVICKLSESLSIAGLIILASSGTVFRETKGPGWRTIGVLLATAVVSGWITYGIARAVEPALPWLSEASTYEQHHEPDRPAAEHQHD